MEIKELFEACIKLGLPMAFLSWLMFSWLYSEGKLEVEANRKTISANLKQMKKSKQKKQGDDFNYVYDKWMWFGGGFYGLAALWTFTVIEIVDFFQFISAFSGFSSLFENGIFDLVVALVVNQITNIISAFIWFTYWSKSSILFWLLAAYAGYWCGIQFAKRTKKGSKTE